MFRKSFTPLTKAAVILIGTAVSAAAQPNLVADLNTKNGTVTIQNIGTAPAGAQIVSVNCTGVCPEPAGVIPAAYMNAALPGTISFTVSPMLAGQFRIHHLYFWNQLFFPKGSSTFTTCADALQQVEESSEFDNCSVDRMRSPGAQVRFRSPTNALKLAE